jgi:hypothetical protein
MVLIANEMLLFFKNIEMTPERISQLFPVAESLHHVTKSLLKHSKANIFNINP